MLDIILEQRKLFCYPMNFLCISSSKSIGSYYSWLDYDLIQQQSKHNTWISFHFSFQATTSCSKYQDVSVSVQKQTVNQYSTKVTRVSAKRSKCQTAQHLNYSRKLVPTFPMNFCWLYLNTQAILFATFIIHANTCRFSSSEHTVPMKQTSFELLGTLNAQQFDQARILLCFTLRPFNNHIKL